VQAARFVGHRRRTISFAVYAGVTLASYALAFAARFEFAIPAEFVQTLIWSALPLVVIRLFMSHVFRISTGRWRFIGIDDIVRLAAAVVAGSAAFVLLTMLMQFQPAVPRSVLMIEPALTTLLTAGVWVAYRSGFESLRHGRISRSARRNVLIVGAGDVGDLLVRQINRIPTGLRAIGFVDDDPLRWGMTVHGVEVIGATSDLHRIAPALQADEILIAVPSAAPADLRRIVQCCEQTGLPYRVLPAIAEVLAGNVSLSHLREVRIEDLLGREPIELELPELAEDLSGRCVAITGAAGSIGSELARQVALHRPARLVLFDQAESELYYLELDLRRRMPGLDIRPVMGDVVDATAVERLFELHRPDRVYHAAAYKHVPMMECNVREAVRNNVLGTRRVAEAAGRHGAVKFVLVSTDKAVRPSSVMGATKRIAEIVVLDLQKKHPKTSYTAVRFGNVLGSNGSVLPLFKRQLAAGQALTVTHPDASRYFMTIPEAVQLILKASLVHDIRGRIAMLDMGDPVRIDDLARNLLRLSGATTSPDRVRYIGLRPGEKLHEELVAPDESTVPTDVPKVHLVISPIENFATLPAAIGSWEAALAETSDDEIRAVLSALFPALRLREDGQDQEPALLPEIQGRSSSAIVRGR
jgi:FlaA1/EpsC-like NDP-sugar epimerase